MSVSWMLLKFSVSLLIFRELSLSNTKWTVLKFLTLIVNFSFSFSTYLFPSACILKLRYLVHTPLDLLFFFLKNWCFHHYEMTLIISGNLFVLKAPLSDTNITMIAFICMLSAWYSFFHPLISSYLCSFKVCLL